jgi:hypothetical protein
MSLLIVLLWHRGGHPGRVSRIEQATPVRPGSPRIRGGCPSIQHNLQGLVCAGLSKSTPDCSFSNIFELVVMCRVWRWVRRDRYGTRTYGNGRLRYALPHSHKLNALTRQSTHTPSSSTWIHHLSNRSAEDVSKWYVPLSRCLLCVAVQVGALRRTRSKLLLEVDQVRYTVSLTS